MFIDSFSVASELAERDFFSSGASTLHIPGRKLGDQPYKIFPKCGIKRIELSKITLLCGSSSTPKGVLIRILATKLGIDNNSYVRQMRYFDEYIKHCYVDYSDPTVKEAPSVFITAADVRDMIDKNNAVFGKNKSFSLTEYYEAAISNASFCILEEPENGLSVEETEMLASLLYDCAKYSGKQFVITTNSLPLLKIKGAAIYDLDVVSPVRCTWSSSRYAKKYKYIEDNKNGRDT